jgi:2',3'-cyclic-nucleotide 2'-phosphodiesterase (5'-nucleotidase family)
LRVAAATALLLSGCEGFNDQCTALVKNPNDVVVQLASEVLLDRPNARHDNNAIGQAAADAFVDAMSMPGLPVDFAIVNSGALRAEGICGATRNIVPAGPLTDQVLHEILLFENIVNAVTLSGQDVRDLFEHSVAQLFAFNTPIVSPAGQFLQVSSSVRMTVDCTRPAGMRVTSLTVNGQPVVQTGTYRVALSAFLLNGGDGYSMIAMNGSNPTQAQKLGGIDSNITSEFLKRTYAGANQTLAKEQRITFAPMTCATPSRP